MGKKSKPKSARVTVTLPEEVIKILLLDSGRRGLSLASLVREIVIAKFEGEL